MLIQQSSLNTETKTRKKKQKKQIEFMCWSECLVVFDTFFGCDQLHSFTNVVPSGCFSVVHLLLLQMLATAEEILTFHLEQHCDPLCHFSSEGGVPVITQHHKTSAATQTKCFLPTHVSHQLWKTHLVGSQCGNNTSATIDAFFHTGNPNERRRLV